MCFGQTSCTDLKRPNKLNESRVQHSIGKIAAELLSFINKTSINARSIMKQRNTDCHYFTNVFPLPAILKSDTPNNDSNTQRQKFSTLNHSDNNFYRDRNCISVFWTC